MKVAVAAPHEHAHHAHGVDAPTEAVPAHVTQIYLHHSGHRVFHEGVERPRNIPMAEVKRADEKLRDARLQPHETGLPRHGVTHDLEEVVDLVPALVDDRVGHAPREHAEHIEVQLPLVPEVEEELAFRHTGAPGDVRRGRAGIVLAAEHLKGGIHDCAPAVFREILEAPEPV